MNDYVGLKPGQRFKHEDFFTLEIRQLDDGVYPYTCTAPATMTLPFRQTAVGLEVCLLEQSRSDTSGSVILKVSGGYNGDLSRENAALQHTINKLGLRPDKHALLWWRQCLGVGPQYQFPIVYSFLQEPVEVSASPAQSCIRRWMLLEDACRMATSRTTEFFDDFSSAHLLILLMNSEEICM